MAHIKRGDKVKVIAGDDKGKVAEVLRVLPKESKVIVAGCHVVKKASSQMIITQKAVLSKKNCQFIFLMCRK